jgi:hypothetical protein
MNLLAEGQKAIDFLTDNESLISGKLEKISIYIEENRLFIDLEIILLYSKKYKNVKLRFQDVQEYSLYYNIRSNFYYIEDYKLFLTSEQVYISLDPADASSIEIDNNDNDFVIAKGLKIYV